MDHTSAIDNSLLSHRLFSQREHGIYHQAYEKELSFYESVQKGDLDSVLRLLKQPRSGTLGTLSNNPVRNLKYHLIIMTAMITRFCMEGGMPLETAYTLSDLYIQQIDITNDETALQLLHNEIVYDFSTRMKELKETHLYSKYITRAIEYISANLHGKMTLTQIAEHAGCNMTYLAQLFKKETGRTPAKYIEECKIESAKEMLLFSTIPSQQISETLGFSSHSHFIAVFRKHMHTTPQKYRSTHYGSHWSKT